MNKWYYPIENLPEQGKKVLCFSNGDLVVKQRFGIYWFPIPFVDSAFANIDIPEKWQEIDFPDGYTGKIYIMLNGEKLDMDTLEKKNPDIFRVIMNASLELYNSDDNKKRRKEIKSNAKQ
jgi:hypothetical protein